MLENLDNYVFSNNNIVFVNQHSDNVTLFIGNIGLNNTLLYVNNINFDNDNFGDDDPGAIIHVRFLVRCNRYKQCKIC